MSENLYPVPADIAATALVDNAKYQEMYGDNIPIELHISFTPMQY